MRTEGITEALLEMHYHQAMMGYFEATYGRRFRRLLKPSPGREAWVGFDQGWALSTVSEPQLMAEIEQAVRSQDQAVASLFLGYFLQFKCVERLTRRSDRVPSGYVTPYLRAELSLKPSKVTRLSQHEILLRVKDIRNASVCYACPMLFSLQEIYRPADLAQLRCVDVRTSPTGWATTESHFITFQDEGDGTPLWCSDPVPATAEDFRHWASPDSRSGPKGLSAEELRELIRQARQAIEPAATQTHGQLAFDTRAGTRVALPESFTIVELGSREDKGGKHPQERDAVP